MDGNGGKGKDVFRKVAAGAVRGRDGGGSEGKAGVFWEGEGVLDVADGGGIG